MAYYPFAPETGGIYTLVSPNGAIAVFNDPNDPNYVGMLTEVTGLDSAEVRESTEELVEADGGVHGNFYLGRRPITMTGRVFGHASALERNLRLDRAARASMALRGDAILSWEPSSRIDNFARNPSATNDASDYTATASGGASITTPPARITTDGVFGTSCIQTVINGAVGGSAQVQNGNTPKYITANPGQVFSGRSKIKISAGTNVSAVKADIGFYNAAGTFISGASGTAINSPATGTWLDISVTGVTAPAGTAFVFLSSTVNTNAAGSATFRLDGLVLTEGTTAHAYFDGSSTGYHWQGNADVSTSSNYIAMFTYVRRQQPFRTSGAWNKDFQIALVSEYAALYSLSQKTASVASGSSVSVENRGSYNAYPLLRITGVATNPVVTNSTNSSAVATTGLTLASGETIEIDTLNHVANFIAGARNGQSANRYINYGNAAAWTFLATGTNSVGLTGGGTLSIVYRDTWA